MNRLGIAGSTCLLLIGSALAQGANAVLPPLARCVMKSPRLHIGSTPTLTINGVTYTTSHQPDAPVRSNYRSAIPVRKKHRSLIGGSVTHFRSSAHLRIVRSASCAGLTAHSALPHVGVSGRAAFA